MDSNLLQDQLLLAALLFGAGLLTALALWKRGWFTFHDKTLPTHRITARAWSPRETGLLFGALFAIYLAAGFAGSVFDKERLPIAQIATMLIFYVVVAIFVGYVRRSRGNLFGMQATNIRHLLTGSVIYLATIPLLMVVGVIFRELLSLFFNSDLPAQEVSELLHGDFSLLHLCYILMAIVGAPFYEEILFRGVLFPYLLRRSNMNWAIGMTSIVFAAIHLHLPSAAPLILMSVVSCLLYWRTGSLWSSIGLHATWNTTAIFVLNLGG